MAKIHIRRTSDLRKVQALDVQLIGDVLSASDLASSTWWLARVDGEVVGYCGARVVSTDAECVYFIRSGVLPDYQGMGIGKRLIQARIAWSIQQGATILVTETMSDNISSMCNLISAGFKPYMPETPWVGTDNVVYWRKLL